MRSPQLLALLAVVVGVAIQQRACAAEVAAPAAPAPAVVINELMADNRSAIQDGDGAFSDWVELCNTGLTVVQLEGWFLTDDLKELDKWSFPATALQPKETRLVWCSGKDRRDPSAPLHTSFKLARAHGSIALVKPDKQTVVHSIVDYPTQLRDHSYGWPQHFERTLLVGDKSHGSFLVPEDEKLGDRWVQRDFVPDPATWMGVVVPVGYDQKEGNTLAGEIRSDVGLLQRNKNASSYLLLPFEVSDPAGFQQLALNLRYEDGFVAWLNGVRIASDLVPDAISWNSESTDFHEIEEHAGTSTFGLNERLGLLHPGKNVLALQLLVRYPRSRDMLAAPTLMATTVAAPVMEVPVYFAVATPGAPNGGGFRTICATPVISVKGGSFREPVTVELQLPSGQGEIRYTIDGSVPSTTSPLYREPIKLTQSVRLTARAYEEECCPSALATESYVFYHPRVERFTSDLPIIVINTFGQDIQPKQYIDASVQLFECGADKRSRLSAEPSLMLDCAVKFRGSSTINLPKKSLAIELRDADGNDKDVALLGLPADSDWVLYGSYKYDLAGIRNPFVYALSNAMGRYAPRCRFVEAYFSVSGESLSPIDFVGIYVLIEKVKAGPERVAVTDPAGGFVLKIDRPGPDEKGFFAGHQHMQFVYPKECDIRASEADAIKAYIDGFGRALAGPDFADPEKGYAAWIDVDSFIDHHLIQELTKNPDAYELSTYFFKRPGGKLEAGPVWDFDRALRTNTSTEWVGRAEQTSGWTEPRLFNWWGMLLSDPAFVERYRARGRALRKLEWSDANVSRIIDAMAAELTEAQVRNYERWGYYDAEKWQEEIAALKNWISVRGRWLDVQFIPVPLFQSSTGSFVPPFELSMTFDGMNEGQVGQIQYTVDGSSPRVMKRDGGPMLYESPISVTRDTVVRATVRTVGSTCGDESSVTCSSQLPRIVPTEIMYRPADTDDLEFVELMNAGDEPVDMTQLSFKSGMHFEFKGGSVQALAPGEHCVIVRNLAAFRGLHDIEGIKIAGEFPGNLNNYGERLRLVGPDDAVIFDVLYANTWHPTTDAEGHSLVLVDPHSSPDTWRDPKSWRPSTAIDGSPGQADPSPRER